VVQVTVPVGVLVIPCEVSVTVAVHVDAWLTLIVEGIQVIVVAVVSIATVTIVPPLLGALVGLPVYIAETCSVPGIVGVMVTVQVGDGPMPVRVHMPPGVKATVPVGEIVAALLMSDTVAVQVVA